MENTFEKFSDEQLFCFIAKNCPEGSLFNAVDELADRYEFCKQTLKLFAESYGMDLEEFLAWLYGEDDAAEPEPELESLSLEELTSLYEKVRAEHADETKRKDLIAAIKALRGE